MENKKEKKYKTVQVENRPVKIPRVNTNKEKSGTEKVEIVLKG